MILKNSYNFIKMQNIIKIPIKMKYNLIQRRAAALNEIANFFTSTEIFLSKESIKINAKSILSILFLSCRQEDIVYIHTQGEQAETAAASMARALCDPFGIKEKEILTRLKTKNEN